MKAFVGIVAGVTMAASILAATEPEPVDYVPRSGKSLKVVKFSSLPAYEPNRLPDGRPEELTIREIVGELRMVTSVELNMRGDSQRPAPYPRIVYRTDRFSVVDHDWCERFIAWVVKERGVLGLKYRAEQWDCDNYSMMLAAFADLAALECPDHHSPQLIARLVVDQRYAWAGVPAGGRHELTLFRSNATWWVVEPQTGKHVNLWEYPNRTFIHEILLN